VHQSIVRLAELLEIPSLAGDAVDWAAADWAAAEVHWGTAFPPDYRDFVSAFGGGSINASFHIAVPWREDASSDQALSFERLVEEVAYSAEFTGEEPPAGIPWALDCQSNHVYWDTAKSSRPEDWTVFVHDNHGERVDFDCGMGDFLVGVLTRAISPQPVGLFSPERPVFLSAREERRRREAGLDAWPNLS
jgi:hypothetical protein